MGIQPNRSDDPLVDDDVAGVLAAAVQPAELSNTERDALKRRVLARISAPAPEGTYTVRASEAPWQKVSDLVQLRVVRKDAARNNQTILIRMLPGASIVPHPHSQEEECLVLEGAVEIGEHRLYEGDMHVAGAGVKHPRIDSPLGALLMIRSEIPPEGFAIT
jgi:quercetin dioxygenase-like cupin family protein